MDSVFRGSPKAVPRGSSKRGGSWRWWTRSARSSARRAGRTRTPGACASGCPPTSSGCARATSGKRSSARATIMARGTTRGPRRIGSQITADGRPPYELVRTRSLSYSAMNLEGLGRLAELARHVGVDLWSYESPAGGSIRKALDYLTPYAAPARDWPVQQITPSKPDLLV